MDRRSFLVSAGGLALSQLTAGCSRGSSADLKVRLLKDSIPAQLTGEFRRELQQPSRLSFDPEEQLKELFNRLQAWKKQATNIDPPSPFSFARRQPPAVANLVTIGDFWLAQAIQQELIQPLDIAELSGWQQLPNRWKLLVERNSQGEVDKSGAVWGAPYRWGSTVIAYRRDKFQELGWTPTDWSDLWRPELKDRISLLSSPRETIGLTLKKLGHSYNTLDLAQVNNLEKELLALHQQARLYSSDKYLQPLMLGDTWLAVGWSTDLLSLRSHDRQIEVVVPRSGTALWADLWVQPKSNANPNSALVKKWINFCWQPKPAIEITLFSEGTSPIINGMKPANLPQDIQSNPLLLPDEEILDRSEFLLPLPKEVQEEYLSLWREVRV
jgi:putative spermidine/putrescine transport system substrate-binding protein